MAAMVRVYISHVARAMAERTKTTVAVGDAWGKVWEVTGVGEGRSRFVCRTRRRNDQSPRALEKPEVL